MDLKTLELQARNRGQLLVRHGRVTVTAKRTQYGWQHSYFIDGIQQCAKAAAKLLARDDQN